MMFGKLVPRNGHLAQEILGLNGEVVGYQDIDVGYASGSSGSIEVQHAAAPVFDSGSSYFEYDFSTFDMNRWQWGPYSGANWQGHAFEIDVSKFWTSTSISIETHTSVTDFWGSSFSGPGYESSNGHSQSAQTLDLQSESFDGRGLSLLFQQGHSEQSFDFDHIGFGNVTIDTEHAEQAATTEIHQISFNANGVSGSDQLSVSHDAYDSFRFATPTGAMQQTSSVHDDLTLADWFVNASHGSSVETNHTEHSDQLLISSSGVDISVHTLDVHQLTATAHLV